MELFKNRNIKNLIYFLYEEYNVITDIETKLPKDINGVFTINSLGFRKKSMFINLNMKESIEGEIIDKEVYILYVLSHEIGHFLLEKAGAFQREEYADYLGIELIHQLSTKIEFGKFIREISKIRHLKSVIDIKKEDKKDMNEIIKIFIYKYNKFCKNV